jgi:ribosomal protein S27E
MAKEKAAAANNDDVKNNAGAKPAAGAAPQAALGEYVRVQCPGCANVTTAPDAKQVEKADFTYFVCKTCLKRFKVANAEFRK